MKRIIYTIMAAAAIITGGVAAAAPAMASPNPNPGGNGLITVTSQDQANALPGTVKNVDVPAGVNVWISYRHITGNVTVEGQLTMASDLVDNNVIVSGPGSFLELTNQASHIRGNLNVQNSSGIYQGGPGTMSFGNWTQYAGADLPTAVSQVDGNVNFNGNSGSLWVGYPMHVLGNLNYSGNTAQAPPALGGLTVDGQQNVSS